MGRETEKKRIWIRRDRDAWLESYQEEMAGSTQQEMENAWWRLCGRAVHLPIAFGKRKNAIDIYDHIRFE